MIDLVKTKTLAGEAARPKGKKTSNQINQKRRKTKTDYENLLLLQKIQNAKPSSWVKKSFH